MNYTITRAGTATHLKIAAVALASVIAFVVIGFSAKPSFTEGGVGATANAVIKARHPAAFAADHTSSVR